MKKVIAALTFVIFLLIPIQIIGDDVATPTDIGPTSPISSGPTSPSGGPSTKVDVPTTKKPSSPSDISPTQRPVSPSDRYVETEKPVLPCTPVVTNTPAPTEKPVEVVQQTAEPIKYINSQPQVNKSYKIQLLDKDLNPISIEIDSALIGTYGALIWVEELECFISVKKK